MTFRARWVRGGHYKSRPGSLASFKQTNQSAASEALSIRLLLHLEWRIGSECEGRSWGEFSPLSLSVFLWFGWPGLALQWRREEDLFGGGGAGDR